MSCTLLLDILYTLKHPNEKDIRFHEDPTGEQVHISSNEVLSRVIINAAHRRNNFDPPQCTELFWQITHG